MARLNVAKRHCIEKFAEEKNRQLLLGAAIGIVLGGICGCLILSRIALNPDRVIALSSPAKSTNAPALGTPAIAVPTTRSSTSTTPLAAQHFLVGRPVMLNVVMPYPDPVYLYGTTEKGAYDVHHGEDFENPIGTPIYAAADGRVVVAGSDNAPICGDDGRTICGPDLSSSGYYGNLVVVQLSQSFQGQRVFVLYGHMNQIAISLGDQVKTGGAIGQVGMSGVAIGPHVHFEIRLGVNDYAHTRNPILWMAPLAGHGSLAGRYTDAQGNLVAGALVDIYHADYTFVHETETYSRDRWPAVNSDNTLGENFAMGDLPAGDYVVQVPGQPFGEPVTIEAGKLSMVEIGGK